MWEEKNNDSWEKELLKFSRAFKDFYYIFIPYLFLSKLENVGNPMIERDSFETKTTLLPTVSVKIISF